jgi:hypothetical protein
LLADSACIELGIDGTFWPEKADKARDVLPMIRRG